jgi:hypothetical protein
MYDNGGEENIKEFFDIIQEHYYKEVSIKPLLTYKFGKCVVVIQGLVVRKEQTK